jgi:hypothetical protein
VNLGTSGANLDPGISSRCSSPDLSPSSRTFAELNPRQLAPTVGIAATGFCYPGGILQIFSSTRSASFHRQDQQVFHRQDQQLLHRKDQQIFSSTRSSNFAATNSSIRRIDQSSTSVELIIIGNLHQNRPASFVIVI